MKQVVKVILAAAALVALAVPAMAAPGVPKLKVQNSTQTTKFVVNDDGTVGLGVSSTIYPLEMTSDNATNVPAGVGSFFMKGSTNKERLEIQSYGGVGAQQPVFQGKGAGWNGTAPTATVANHTLFALGGSGHNGTNMVIANGVMVRMKAEADWTATSNPTYVTFETNAAGFTADNRSEKMRVSGNGTIRFSNQPAAPANSAPGTVGDMIVDAAGGYIYFCTGLGGTSNWKRIGMATY